MIMFTHEEGMVSVYKIFSVRKLIRKIIYR